MDNKRSFPKDKQIELEYVLNRESRQTLILGKNASKAIQQSILHLFIHCYPLPPIVVKEDANGIHTAAINGYVASTLIDFINGKIKYEKEDCLFNDLRLTKHLMETPLAFIVLTPDIDDIEQAAIIKAYSMQSVTAIS